MCRLFYNVSHWYARTTCTPVGTVLECRAPWGPTSLHVLCGFGESVPQRILFERVQEYGVSGPLLELFSSVALDFTQLVGFEFVGLKRWNLHRVVASKCDWNGAQLSVSQKEWAPPSLRPRFSAKKGWCSHLDRVLCCNWVRMSCCPKSSSLSILGFG